MDLGIDPVQFQSGVDRLEQAQLSAHVATHLQQTTRRDQAGAEELAERWSEAVRVSLENILFARPCEPGADFEGAIRFLNAHGPAQDFFIRLRALQPAIEEIWNAWSAIPIHIFAAPNDCPELRRRLIQEGCWAGVIALQTLPRRLGMVFDSVSSSMAFCIARL